MIEAIVYAKAVRDIEMEGKYEKFVLFVEGRTEVHAYFTEAEKLYDLGLSKDKYFFSAELPVKNLDPKKNKYKKVLDTLLDNDYKPVIVHQTINTENTPMN